MARSFGALSGGECSIVSIEASERSRAVAPGLAIGKAHVEMHGGGGAAFYMRLRDASPILPPRNAKASLPNLDKPLHGH